jgi:alkylation response protein AidB-like acyl-CoA dehydrogenase
MVSDGIEHQLTQIEALPDIGRLKSLHRLSAGLDRDTVADVLHAANGFSRTVLEPFEARADRLGCLLESERVVLAPGHEEAWQRFREDGWVGIDLPQEYGGQALPMVVSTAVQELFDRGSVGFGMLSCAIRSAARLLLTHGDDALVREWLPQLACGNWGATICISEAGAGTDVGRIRTVGVKNDLGEWLITGEKLWTSYGDHPLTERIGHLLLGRTHGAPEGIPGLSLFLVPGGDKVKVRRVEEKLGLNGSPTCALGFEGAPARLIGSEGRGVSQLFRMIVAMRLQVGSQALGLVAASLECAQAYAQSRHQGGPPNRPPVPIEQHSDIRRMLMAIASRLETLRGIVYSAAAAVEIADRDEEQPVRQESSVLSSWLLPIVKNSGAEAASDSARTAMLILGGAGYTREWPIERYLRDAQVLAIYEGTTGAQAADLIRRRWLKPGTGAEVFRAVLLRECGTGRETDSAISAAIEIFDEATAWIRDAVRTEQELSAAAYSALTLASELAHGWIAARLARLRQDTGAGRRLAACGRHGLSVMLERVPAALRSLKDSPKRVQEFEVHRIE